MPNNDRNIKGGAYVPNPSSIPRVIRDGVETAPSPTYQRPIQPKKGNGGKSGK